MLPRIEAEEQLSRVTAIALGTGAVQKHEARRALAQLERQAGGVRRKAAKASPETLMAMGIAVTVLPPRGSEPVDV